MRNKLTLILILLLAIGTLSCSGPMIKEENNYAIKMLEKGVLKEAEFRFRQQITEDPENWVAHNNLGVVLEEMGRLEEALMEYETALSIIVENKGVEYNYSTLLGELEDE